MQRDPETRPSAYPTLTAMHPRAIHWKSRPASTLAGNAVLLNAWDRLNAGRGNLPFLGSRAVTAALQVFGRGTERLLVGQQGDNIVALFLLEPGGALRWQTFQPAQLPLGAWVASPDLTLEELSASLIERGPLGRCLVLSVTQVDPRFVPRADDTASTRHDDYIDTPWIAIEGEFEDYWRARCKDLRQNLARRRRKLSADGVVPWMRELRDPGEMVGALQRYGVLESQGWKAAGGTAIHPDNDQGRFYRLLLEEAARQGEALVYEYLFDDRTVAMNLCLHRGGMLVVLKTTYDESLRSLSPAFLLGEDEMKSMFQTREFARLEYYGRLMEWHTRWTDRKCTLYHHTRYRWPWVKTLAMRRRRSDASPQTADAADDAMAHADASGTT